MSEISRENAMMNIKAIRDLWDNKYDYKSEYRDFLEDDPIVTLNKAISDMEKLDRIESTRPIDLINEFGDLEAEKFNKISHWFSQSQKLEKIEKILNEYDCSECGCNGIEEECNECHNEWIADIKQIVKEA